MQVEGKFLWGFREFCAVGEPRKYELIIVSVG